MSKNLGIVANKPAAAPFDLYGHSGTITGSAYALTPPILLYYGTVFPLSKMLCDKCQLDVLIT